MKLGEDEPFKSPSRASPTRRESSSVEKESRDAQGTIARKEKTKTMVSGTAWLSEGVRAMGRKMTR